MKVICDYDKFVEKFLPVIEKEMIPLFKYIDRTQKVDFDEEIVLIVTSFLKISKKVTPILQQIFPQYVKIFMKNKCIFGHLFHSFNLYLVHGKEMFTNHQEYIKQVRNFCYLIVIPFLADRNGSSGPQKGLSRFSPVRSLRGSPYFPPFALRLFRCPHTGNVARYFGVDLLTDGQKVWTSAVVLLYNQDARRISLLIPEELQNHNGISRIQEISEHLPLGSLPAPREIRGKAW